MALLRQLGDLRTQTLRLADLERAVSRFPPVEVNFYINCGLRYVFRQLLIVADRPFYQSSANIVIGPQMNGGVIPNVTTFALPADFLQIMSVLWATTQSGPFMALGPIEESQRHMLINAGYLGAQWPSAYNIIGSPGVFTQGTIPTAYGMEILPQIPVGSMVSLRYVPSPPNLVNDTDTFDGILGFEDAACTWAAILMRRKEDLDTSDLERDMARHLGEIRAIAKRRDRSRPPKVQIVRGGRHGRRGRNWGPGRF